MTSHTRGRLPARRHVCRAIAIFLPMWLAADMAGAQFVAIAGDYAEALGLSLIHI